VTGDTIDVLEAGECESADLAGGPGPGPGPAPGLGVGTLDVELQSKRTGKISKLTSRSGFVFRLTVSDACRATVKIIVAKANARRLGLGRRAVVLASATDAIPEAGTYEARLAARRKYRKRLRELRRVPAKLSFACAAAGGTERTSRKVTFKR
jgi:hypothetical protein